MRRKRNIPSIHRRSRSIMAGIATLVLLSSLGIYANAKNSIAETTPGEYNITTSSGESEIALAQHLKQVGAKMYGAFWCPYCQNQKQLFGQEAVAQLNYIECDPTGKNARPEVCQAKGIQGLPTWEIKGKFYEGTKSLEELANLSSYQGDRRFQNTLSNGQ
jgi:glutaredoxin